MNLRIPTLIVSILAGLSASGVQAQSFNSDKIGNLLKNARNDMTIVCAHRGLHGTAVGTNAHADWLRDIPENSVAAIEATNASQCVPAKPIRASPR